jgi:hypothetical protein
MVRRTEPWTSLTDELIEKPGDVPGFSFSGDTPTCGPNYAALIFRQIETSSA